MRPAVLCVSGKVLPFLRSAKKAAKRFRFRLAEMKVVSGALLALEANREPADARRKERLALGERSKGIGSGENQLRHCHIVQMTPQRRSDKPKPPPTGSTAAHLEPGSSGSGLILFRTNR